MVFTNREQRDLLSGIRVKERESKRIDCPFCYGKKTFTISNVNGKLIWNCYKASCGARGAKGTSMSAEAVRRRLRSSEKDTLRRRIISFPAVLSEPDHHARAVEYLRTNGAYDAYKNQLINVRYAPAEDRVLFYTRDLKGATGRSLRGEKPKWKVYGEISPMIQVGSGTTAVVVEDVPSACNIGMLPKCSGCALLGTSINSTIKSLLSDFTNVVIALDSDASQKALRILTELQGRLDCRVVFLGEDPKHVERHILEEKIFEGTRANFSGL